MVVIIERGGVRRRSTVGRDLPLTMADQPRHKIYSMESVFISYNEKYSK